MKQLSFIHKPIYLALFLLFAFWSVNVKAQVPSVMQWSAQVDLNQDDPDWIFDIKETSDGCFIAACYSNPPSSSASVRPSLIKLDPSGNVLWHRTFDPQSNGGYGLLNCVIEDNNGNYVATGYQHGAARVALLIIVDKDGNLLNSSDMILPQLSSTSTDKDRAFGVAQAPDGDYLVTQLAQDSPEQGYLVKTNGYGTVSATWNYGSYSSTDYNFRNVQLGTVNSSTDFDVILTGSHVTSVTDITGYNQDGSYFYRIPGYPCPLGCVSPTCQCVEQEVWNSKIDAYSVNFDGSSFNLNWHQDYDHADFTNNQYYTGDEGPYYYDVSTSSGNAGCTSTNTNSPALNDYFTDTDVDVPSNLIIYPPTGGDKIIISCEIDIVKWDDNQFNHYDGVQDCSSNPSGNPRWGLLPSTATVNNFKEVKDFQGYLLMLDYDTGNPISTLTGGNPKHLGHFSGEDFWLGMAQDACGNIYASGTLADHAFGPETVAEGDLTQIPIKNDALICKVDDQFNILWRRNFMATGLATSLLGHQNVHDYSDNDYDGNCIFGCALTKKDNGLILAGNNLEQNDNYLFIKLSSDEQLNKTWDYTSWSTPGSCSPCYWPDNGSTATVKENIFVNAGATLYIQNATIEFGETKEQHDYNADISNINTTQCGIIIEEGARLIIENSILRGLSEDVGSDCSRDYMWDGIVVIGNPSLAQSVSNQGWLEVNSGSRIENARCGIHVDSRTYFNNQPIETDTYLDGAGNGDEWNRGRLSYTTDFLGGGVVMVDHTEFLNNRKDVEFSPYLYASNISTFDINTFTCDAPMVDPDFKYYDNTYELFMPAGVNQHVSIWENEGIAFQECSFENSYSFPWDQRGTGIASADASFEVLYCDFTTNTHGVYAEDISNTSLFPHVDHSNFNTNHGGIYERNINNSVITLNNFYVGLYGKADYGIYLEDCSGYTIEQNNFYNYNVSSSNVDFGIINYFSYSNSNHNEIYNNYFNAFDGAAILAEGIQNDGSNDGLVIRCNGYEDNIYDEYTPDMLIGSGQGIANPQGSNFAAGAANNNFITDCISVSSTDGELYNEATSDVQAYIYYHCQDITGYNVEPTSGCYTPFWVVPTQVNTPYTSTDCPSNFLAPPGDWLAEAGNFSELENSLRQRLNSNKTEIDSAALDSLIFYHREHERLLNQAISHFLIDSTLTNPMDSVILLLQGETSINRKMQLADAYITVNNYDSALSIIAALSTYTALSNYCTIQNAIINMKQQNLPLTSVSDSADLLLTIETIANDTLHAGYSKARGILTLITGEHYPEVIRFDTSYAYEIRKEKVMFEIGKKLLRNYPNPFTDETTIEVIVDDKINNPELIIYDMVGKSVNIIKLSNGFNQVNLSGNSLIQGIYYYSLVSEEKRLATEKMIYMH
jgi:hypothetical protein